MVSKLPSSNEPNPKTTSSFVANPHLWGINSATLFTPPTCCIFKYHLPQLLLLFLYFKPNQPISPSIPSPSSVVPIPPSLPTMLNMNAHFWHLVTEANFLKWKFFHFYIVLWMHKLCHVIEEDDPAQLFPDGSVNLDFDTGYTTDQLVLSWILATLLP